LKESGTSLNSIVVNLGLLASAYESKLIPLAPKTTRLTDPNPLKARSPTFEIEDVEK
jgi:hypothetical protein